MMQASLAGITEPHNHHNDSHNGSGSTGNTTDNIDTDGSRPKYTFLTAAKMYFSNTWNVVDSISIIVSLIYLCAW